MSLKNKEPHVVSVNMEDYLQIIIGLRKTGKTTLFRDMILSKYGTPKAGLLLAFEPGYTALNNIIAEPIEDWNYFQMVVNELVYDKAEMPYKIIAIDTIDEMVNMAENQAIKFFNSKAECKKKATTLNEAGGGFNRGKNHTIKILRESILKLRKAGYGIFLIGHSKEKKKKNEMDMEYIQLSCNLTDDYNDVFLNSADMITFLTTEKNVSNSSIVGEEVYMNFRGTRFDCGNRLKHVPDRIKYDVDGYINVFENAVTKLAGEANKNVAELAKEQKESNDEKAVNEIKKIKESDLSNLIVEIKETMKEGLKHNTLTAKSISELLELYNVKSPDDIKDFETGNKILNELS